jgi:hypothetical protein
MSEHKNQNEIRNDLAGKGLFFRVNVGQAWTGDVHRLKNGDILIKNPRPFSTGLPGGFSDLFGITPVTITPEMVGQRAGIFTAIEVKSEKGRVSPKQSAFLSAVKNQGGRSGVARTIEDARRVIAGEDLQQND